MSSPQYWADGPTTGAYQEHELAPVFAQAGWSSLFFNLASKRRVASGQSLTVPSYTQLDFPTSTVLDEDQPIPLSKLTITAKTISMSERGRAVAITKLAQQRSPFDVLQAHKDVVAEMMQREMEEVISTALKTTPIDYVMNGVASQSITVGGTPSATASANPNVYHLQYLSNYMEDNLRVPKDPRFGAYVGVFRGNGFLSIMRDPEFLEINKGERPEVFDSFFVGRSRIADIVLMKCNDSRVLSNSIGTGSAYSEGLIMGADACLFGFIDQIGLHYDFSASAATDFGRFKYIAWRGDYGAGLHNDSANAGLARAIHITSA